MVKIYRNFFFAGVFLFSVVQAQAVTGFVRADSIPVFDNSQLLLNPWAGGINFAEFSEIDLNMDGIQDLFVFDRTGNKITTYLNMGTPNQVDYKVAPQYVNKFPLLHDWALLRDYNCDGKADIFSYSVAGFSIYKNISTVATGLQFQLMQFCVNTDRSPNSTHFMGNLFVSNVDVPAIRDLDGDGDLDLLTFSNGGNQVEYHKNMSMELYGVCDSIHYITSSNCWGEFTEDALNSTIYMNTNCPAVPMITHNEDHVAAAAARMHSGSCLDCINTDGDNDLDLVLGDISSNLIAFLRNGGTNTFALIDSVDQNYPSYDTPVSEAVYNCPFHIDVNNDGLKDLLVSPGAMNVSENFTSVRYYQNTSTNSTVHLSFVQNDFLQNTMLDFGEGAYPVFFDYDNDGDQDLFVGNFGYYNSSGIYTPGLALLKNTGSPTIPTFTLMTRDFANLSSLNIQHMAVTFGDLDGDGDKDMLIGGVNGSLYQLRKDPGPADNFVFVAANYQSIDIGDYAAPQLIDVDRDGLLDLLIGERSGTLNYYHNTGTSSSPTFTLVSQLFGAVNVRQPGYPTGYSMPCMYDDAGNYVLLVGSERGYVYRYDNIDNNLGGSFTLTDSMYVSAYEGGSLGVSVANLNGDNLVDVVIGNYSGGVTPFYGDNNVSTGQQYALAQSAFLLYPNPAQNEITIENTSPKLVAKEFFITDLSGKRVLETSIQSERTTISLAGLPAGAYLCTLIYDNGFTVNNKLIINR